ncbi:MAG: N-acetyltransferase [Thaumarchaeota archaeon]|nr:N-acetyltransferase [Nitrososphaerota archaeon]
MQKQYPRSKIYYDHTLDETQNASELSKTVLPFPTVMKNSANKTQIKICNADKSYIANDFKYGYNCMIASMVHIDKDVIIGNNVSIQGLVYIPPKTRIGNNVFIAPQVGFSNDHYPPSEILQGVTIENNVIIGFGAKIIGGVTVGENSIIGMGSIVTKCVPSNQIWFGNPAKFQYPSKRY